MVQTLHTSGNILHVFIHKNVLIMFQYRFHFSLPTSWQPVATCLHAGIGGAQNLSCLSKLIRLQTRGSTTRKSSCVFAECFNCSFLSCGLFWDLSLIKFKIKYSESGYAMIYSDSLSLKPIHCCYCDTDT